MRPRSRRVRCLAPFLRASAIALRNQHRFLSWPMLEPSALRVMALYLTVSGSILTVGCPTLTTRDAAQPDAPVDPEVLPGISNDAQGCEMTRAELARVADYVIARVHGAVGSDRGELGCEDGTTMRAVVSCTSYSASLAMPRRCAGLRATAAVPARAARAADDARSRRHTLHAYPSLPVFPSPDHTFHPDHASKVKFADTISVL